MFDLCIKKLYSKKNSCLLKQNDKKNYNLNV